MPIFPPGQSSDKNGFPAYREFEKVFTELSGNSVELFLATETRQQRQIHLLNEGPELLYVEYGGEASENSAIYIREGYAWIDSNDGGMSVSVFSQNCSVRGFIRSEGPIILPEAPVIVSNIQEITDAPWVVPAPTQPSFQVFKALDEAASITVLDPQNIMRDNSFMGVDFYVSQSYNTDDDLPYGAGGGYYLGSFPQNPDTYLNEAPATFEWNTSIGFYGIPMSYFWLKTNLGITDYVWRYFSMQVIGPSLLEIVDYQTY